MPILFKNPGVLEIRALRTFGWTAKIHDNPIGQFGSGSRYALSILLRTNHVVTLYCGLDRYTFGTTRVNARGVKDLDVVTMTGPDGKIEELPFTLELGKGWAGVWCAFRELHSNVIDEHGTTESLSKFGAPFVPTPDETAIIVEGEEIEAAHRDRESIFLSSAPMLSSARLEVHHGPAKTAFYRGVRIVDLPQSALFKYNLLCDTKLTEDRTLKDTSDLQYEVARMVAETSDENWLRQMLVAPQEKWEHHIYPWGFAPGPTFTRIYKELRESGSALLLTNLANKLYSLLNEKKPLPPPIQVSKVQGRQLEKALEFCRKRGWPVDEYPVMVVPYAKGGLMALAEDNKIILTTAVFDAGTKTVAAALLEEALHLKYGFNDLSREFQTHLFGMIVGLAEELEGEPL